MISKCNSIDSIGFSLYLGSDKNEGKNSFLFNNSKFPFNRREFRLGIPAGHQQQ